MDAYGNDVVEAVVVFRSDATGLLVSSPVRVSGTDAALIERRNESGLRIVLHLSENSRLVAA